MFKRGSLSTSAVRKAVQRLISGPEGVAGAALVEFTFFAPILLAIAVYTMDFGLLFFIRTEVLNAAQAGAQYAIVNNTYDAAAISSAVTKATKFTAVTPTSSEFCGCPSATAVLFCSASCETCNVGTCNKSVQGHYVTVTAAPTTPYQTFIPFALVRSSYNVSSTSTVRIR